VVLFYRLCWGEAVATMGSPLEELAQREAAARQLAAAIGNVEESQGFVLDANARLDRAREFLEVLSGNVHEAASADQEFHRCFTVPSSTSDEGRRRHEDALSAAVTCSVPRRRSSAVLSARDGRC
jgi:hypothetical protein